MQRLHKALAAAGVASRRKCEGLIVAGRVRVNGEIVCTLGATIDPGADRVSVDGRDVELQSARLWVMLHKPRGYLSACSDPRGRPTVADLVAHYGARLFPVGRLDMDTEGLLLLTNDGELAHRLTHPRFGIPKTYVAEVHDVPSAEALRTLARGVALEDGRTSPAQVRLLGRRSRRRARIEISIAEGKKRQVRRMLAAVGHPVRALRRVRVGPLSLGDLAAGEARELSAAEVAALRRAADPKGGHGDAKAT
ncbi:MAG: pseudouridine synthase [Armatimonadota bacterium]|jgi:pseudouridine synthase